MHCVMLLRQVAFQGNARNDPAGMAFVTGGAGEGFFLVVTDQVNHFGRAGIAGGLLELFDGGEEGADAGFFVALVGSIGFFVADQPLTQHFAASFGEFNLDARIQHFLRQRRVHGVRDEQFVLGIAAAAGCQ